MLWNLDEKLFPNALPFERRRKMAALLLRILGLILLVAAVAWIIIRVSGVSPLSRSAYSHRSCASVFGCISLI